MDTLLNQSGNSAATYDGPTEENKDRRMRLETAQINS